MIDIDPLSVAFVGVPTNRPPPRMEFDARLSHLQAARRWWLVDARRRQLGAASAPNFAVYRGVVRAAYRIEGWEPAPTEEVRADTKVAGRWGFCGTPAVELLERYGFGDVTSMLPQAAQDPLGYVNCGN